jgi:hypothetical protein
MIIAGADLATTSGLAILDGTRVVHIESHRPAGKTDCEIFTGFRIWLRAMLLAHNVEHLGIEAPLVTDIKAPARGPNAKPGETHNPVTMKTYLRLYGLRAHAVQIAHSLNIGCTEIHQATWRKSFTGNGRATKDDVLKLAQRLVPGLKSKDSSDALGVAWSLNGELSKTDLFTREVA